MVARLLGLSAANLHNSGPLLAAAAAAAAIVVVTLNWPIWAASAHSGETEKEVAPCTRGRVGGGARMKSTRLRADNQGANERPIIARSFLPEKTASGYVRLSLTRSPGR